MESPLTMPAAKGIRNSWPQAEYRKSVILLRWLLVILAAYLIVFRYINTPDFALAVSFLAACALSNVALTLAPQPKFASAVVQRALTAADILFVSSTLYLLHTPGTYFYIGFVAVFVIAAIWREFMVLLFSLVIVSLLYGALSEFPFLRFGGIESIEQFLTEALVFIVSVYYLFYSDRILRDARMTAQLVEENRRTDVMLEITRSISSSLNTQEILYLIVTRLLEVFDGRDCSIMRVDAQTRTARILVKSSNPKLREEDLDLAEYPELLQAFDSQELLFVPGASRGGSAPAVVVVPMRVKNTVLGLIYIRLNENGTKLSEGLSEGDERFFRLMSAIAANALKNAELFEEMEHRARTDFLTGLPNHRSFQATLSTELGRAQRHNHPLSLLIIDLDFLKGVNDRFGHPTGDMVIRAIAETICKGCREFDVAARYGGEEFTVILPETPLEDANFVAGRIREMIANTSFPGVGTITASIGVANFPVNALGKEDLIRVADKALYLAKNKGRDRVEFFSYQFITR